jgi:hypothetical protein
VIKIEDLVIVREALRHYAATLDAEQAMDATEPDLQIEEAERALELANEIESLNLHQQ